MRWMIFFARFELQISPPPASSVSYSLQEFQRNQLFGLFKMDDDFELSEEDFLRAALDIEAATQQQQQPSISENLSPKDCISQTVHSAISSLPLVTSSSIFNDSDDSDIDLSFSIGHSENLFGYDSKQTGIFALKTVSVPSPKLTVHSHQDSRNANGFVNITPTVSQLRTSDSSSNVRLKSQSNNVLRSSTNLPLNSGFKNGTSKNELENKVVCQASTSSLLLDQERAVSIPRLHAAVSHSAFPFVASDENLMRKRKFPGPAGILPKLKTCSKVDNIFSEQPANVTDVPTTEAAVTDVPCTQSQEIHFQSSAWKAMKDDLGAQAELILTDFCINSIIQKANAKILPRGKVPVLCAIIEGVKVHSADASVTLRDPSGFIYGTMHRELLRDHLERIQTGTVIVLRQVGVLCPSGRRNFYLNITPNNVVGFYSLDESGRPLRMKVRELTEEDFLMLTEEPAQLNSNCSIASPQLERQPETTGALFSTVSSDSSFNQCNRPGAFNNPRVALHPSGRAVPFGRSFEPAGLSAGSRLTASNSTDRSFVVPLQRPKTPILTPQPSPLRPTSSRLPNIVSPRMQPVQFESRPASVQPMPRLATPMRSFPQSNSGAGGFNSAPNAVVTTVVHNSFLSKENLLDNRSNSQSSQSTFRFKKLSTTKSPPSSALAESRDPVKEAKSTTAMNISGGAWNSNDYSDYIDDSLLSDLNNEFFSDF